MAVPETVMEAHALTSRRRGLVAVRSPACEEGDEEGEKNDRRRDHEVESGRKDAGRRR